MSDVLTLKMMEVIYKRFHTDEARIDAILELICEGNSIRARQLKQKWMEEEARPKRNDI